MGNTAKQCRLGLFQDSDFAGDLEDSKSTSGGTLCVFGCHTFVPTSWTHKKQTSVSHSSTESEITSLDAGLRLDGLLALELWDLIVAVFGKMTQTTERTVRLVITDRSQKSQGKIDVLNNVDCVPSNVQSSYQEALLYVFEDSEAVIKMIIKGRSPTMRHVSRTHRVALDWLFDRINLDPKIQIKYIDNKNQLADILTKGNFTRDELNHLLSLFSINHFSSTVCFDTMAKRSQQDSGEERVTGKSRPTMNLTARTPSHASSSTSVSPWKSSYGSQDPWSSVAKKEERLERPDIGTHQFKASDHYYHEQFMESFSLASYSKWMTTALCHLKSGKLRSRRTIDQDDLITRKFVSTEPRNPLGTRKHLVTDGSDLISILKKRQDINNSSLENYEAELELSIESRSFVNRVNDQVRKRQKIISNVTENVEKHSLIW